MSDIETMFMSKFYSYLIETACSTPDSYLTVPDISKRINILPQRGKPLALMVNNALERIAIHEVKNGRPMLTALVVKQDKGSNTIFPGAGFFIQAQKLGLYEGSLSDKFACRLFWKEQFELVHSYWKLT